MTWKKNDGGFTLIEFVISIAVASLVTLAATTMLLLGLRIHHKSSLLSAQQNTVSMLYSVMDVIASENQFLTVPSSDSFDPTVNQSWNIQTDRLAISYDDSNDAILLNGAEFAENIISSNATLDSNTGLLTIVIETEENIYNFSIYCRKGVGAPG